MKNSFKKGDRVIVKNIQVYTELPFGERVNSFVEGMEDYIGDEFTIRKTSDKDSAWYLLERTAYTFHESWLKHALTKQERIELLEVRVDALESTRDESTRDTKPDTPAPAGAANNIEWNPKGGEYFVSSSGGTGYGQTASTYANYGVEFDSREQAEQALIDFRRYHRLYQIALELNGEWTPSWTDDCEDHLEPKFMVLYDAKAGDFFISDTVNCYAYGCVYFKSYDIAEQAIAIIEREV